MLFVEAVTTCAPAVTGSTEFHRMFRIAHFRLQHVVLRRQLSNIDQITLLCRLTRTGMVCHCLVLLMQGLDFQYEMVPQTFSISSTGNCIDCMICSTMLHLRPVFVLVMTQYGVSGTCLGFVWLPFFSSVCSSAAK
ncbi:Uncharacterised protein [Kluyvera cryocrescens]|nr:Uncharacterised protein [Kluyvera cryocrescens]